VRRVLTAAAVLPLLLPGEVAAQPGGDAELAAEAPVPEWTYEGGGTGRRTGGDPRAMNKKIRRAGATTIAGASLAIAGGVTAIAGGVLGYLGSPGRLKQLKEDNDYVLPVDDPKRQQIIANARMATFVLASGVSVLVVGVITAAVARSRLKKLREQRRTSMAFGAAPTRGGAALHWEVRF
jgi:energy-converting hydrogenase Eha subunit A